MQLSFSTFNFNYSLISIRTLKHLLFLKFSLNDFIANLKKFHQRMKICNLTTDSTMMINILLIIRAV